jgi:hypothetical protein
MGNNFNSVNWSKEDMQLSRSGLHSGHCLNGVPLSAANVDLPWNQGGILVN